MKESYLKLHVSWEEVKDKLKEINIELTDEDLEYEPGQETELIERLSKKLKKDPERVRALIESVSSTKGIAS